MAEPHPEPAPDVTVEGADAPDVTDLHVVAAHAEDVEYGDELDDADYDPADYDPGPMPASGLAVVGALWLFATGLCACFLVAAVFLAFDLSSEGVPSDQIGRGAVASAGFGLLMLVHLVLAVQLRAGRAWARRATVLLQVGGILVALAGAVAVFVIDVDRPEQASGACVFATVVFACVILMAGTGPMRAWCSR